MEGESRRSVYKSPQTDTATPSAFSLERALLQVTASREKQEPEDEQPGGVKWRKRKQPMLSGAHKGHYSQKMGATLRVVPIALEIASAPMEAAALARV